MNGKRKKQRREEKRRRRRGEKGEKENNCFTFFVLFNYVGSLVAFGKLQGMLSSNALNLPGKNLMNIGMALANVGAFAWFMADPTLATVC